MLFFGTDDIFVRSRQAHCSSVFHGAIAATDQGDVDSAGKLSWIFLMYTLLILPDTKECVVAMTEMLCYLHESSPPELMIHTETPDLSSQSTNKKLISCFPLVLSHFIIDHCTYPTNIPADNVVAAIIRRSGINVVNTRVIDLNEDVETLFQNIRSLRYDPIAYFF